MGMIYGVWGQNVDVAEYKIFWLGNIFGLYVRMIINGHKLNFNFDKT